MICRTLRGTTAWHWRHSLGYGALVLGMAALPSPAAAFNFTLIGDGSSQNLNWLRETCTTYLSGSAWAENGQIPLATSPPGSTMGGGMLSWEGLPGSLKVVAMPVARGSGSTSGSCSGAWGAVDARAVPLMFSIVSAPGDPIPLIATLQIVPRLVGVTEQYTNPGGFADLWLQLTMSVAVDGQVVTSDSLWGTFQLSDGADHYWPLSFPRGGANSKLVTGVTPSTEITINIWAYMRGYTSGSASVDGFSSYGDGPAIEITVRDVNAVDVSDEIAPARLSLAARPNPAFGAARIEYALPRTSPVRLSVFDLAGGRVATLVDRTEEAGSREVTWNGRDPRGERLAPGAYFVELVAGSERKVGKLVLLGR